MSVQDQLDVALSTNRRLKDLLYIEERENEKLLEIHRDIMTEINGYLTLEDPEQEEEDANRLRKQIEEWRTSTKQRQKDIILEIKKVNRRHRRFESVVAEKQECVNTIAAQRIRIRELTQAIKKYSSEALANEQNEAAAKQINIPVANEQLTEYIISFTEDKTIRDLITELQLAQLSQLTLELSVRFISGTVSLFVCQVHHRRQKMSRKRMESNRPTPFDSIEFAEGDVVIRTRSCARKVWTVCTQSDPSQKDQRADCRRVDQHRQKI